MSTNKNLELAKRVVNLNNRIVNLKSQSSILANFHKSSLKGSIQINITDNDDLLPFTMTKTSFNIELSSEIAKILASDINSKIEILENELYHLQRELNQ